MRVALLHNKSAGSENHAAGEIATDVRRAGHEVVAFSTEVRDLLSKVAERSCDLVVIAGGDGTVSRAACAFAGKRVPLAILPLGTANNTAKSLGLEGNVDDLIAGWRDAELCDYDLSTIRLDGGAPMPFSEAVGWGAFPNLMARTEKMSAPDRREHTLERDRSLFAEEIERTKPYETEIELDGTLVRGEYLLVEIVNIPFIGPQLELSPESHPGDGLFELVLAGEHDRKTLTELTCDENRSEARLPTRRAKHAVVRGDHDRFHCDGTLVELARRPRQSSVALERARVQFLVRRRHT